MDRRNGWKWNKDAEFWFTDAYGEVSGGLDHSVQPYAVWFDLASGPRSASRLLTAMQAIHAELPEYELHMQLPSNSDTRHLLDELATAGSITWDEIRNSNSREARITQVVRAMARVSTEQTPPRKRWWQFWQATPR
jgi:hypothetical protein